MSSLPPPPPPSGSPPPPPPDDFFTGGFSGAQPFVPASKGRRVAAGVLEMAIYIGVTVVTAVVVMLLSSASFDSEYGSTGMPFGVGRFGVAIPWLLLSALFFRWSSTPSKRPLNMFIVDSRTGELAGFGQIALREWGAKFLLATLTGGLTYVISAIMLLSTGRSLWDVIARTNVVEER